MGTDARIKDLPQTLNDTELRTLITSLRLVVDDPSYSAVDMKQLLINSLLSDRDIPDNTTIAHKAVTEAGFMKTSATTQKKGVMRYATDAEVLGRTPLVALAAFDFPLAMENETTDNYFNNTNVNYIFDHAFPATTLFQPALSITKIGTLTSLSGAFVVAFAGSVSKFEIWLTGMASPAHITSVAVTWSDGTTMKACGAVIETRNGFTVLTVHVPSAVSLASFYVNAVFQVIA